MIFSTGHIPDSDLNPASREDDSDNWWGFLILIVEQEDSVIRDFTCRFSSHTSFGTIISQLISPWVSF